MHLRETRVAIAATLTGLVLATGIGMAAAPGTTPTAPANAAAVQQVDNGFGPDDRGGDGGFRGFDGRDGR